MPRPFSAPHDDAASGLDRTGMHPDLWLGHAIYRRRAAPGLIARRMAVIAGRPPIAAGAGPLSTRIMARHEAARAHLAGGSEVATASTFPTLIVAAGAAPPDASSAAAGPVPGAGAAHPAASTGAPVVQRRAIARTETALGPLAAAADARSVAPPVRASTEAPAAARTAPPPTIARAAAPSPPVRARAVSRPERVAGNLPLAVRAGAAPSTAKLAGAIPVVPATPAPARAVREGLAPRRAIGAPIRAAPPSAASGPPATARAGAFAADADSNLANEKAITQPRMASARASRTGGGASPPRGADPGDLGASPERSAALSWLPGGRGLADPGSPGRAPDPALAAMPASPRAAGPWDPGSSRDAAPRPASPRGPATPAVPDIGQLADRVYTLLVNRLADERRRRGI